MSRNLVKPFFPVAPEAYDRDYMEQVVRAFRCILSRFRTPELIGVRA